MTFGYSQCYECLKESTSGARIVTQELSDRLNVKGNLTLHFAILPIHVFIRSSHLCLQLIIGKLKSSFI